MTDFDETRGADDTRSARIRPTLRPSEPNPVVWGGQRDQILEWLHTEPSIEVMEAWPSLHNFPVVPGCSPPSSIRVHWLMVPLPDRAEETVRRAVLAVHAPDGSPLYMLWMAEEAIYWMVRHLAAGMFGEPWSSNLLPAVTERGGVIEMPKLPAQAPLIQINSTAARRAICSSRACSRGA